MSHHLLLVEDEAHLAFTLEFNLVAEGYRVTRAERLADGRRLLAEEPPDLLILDVMLPDGSGFDLTRELRAAGDRTPILMLTAKGSADDIVTGLEAGADDYLTKPFALAELLGRVQAMLRRRAWDQGDPAAVPRSITIGERTVDFRTGEVSGGGAPTRLTELELRLLAFFAAHPEQPLSRQRLLTEVWELPASTQTRSVDNFLVRLRRLFEPDPSHPRYFTTVRGEGYRFRP